MVVSLAFPKGAFTRVFLFTFEFWLRRSSTVLLALSMILISTAADVTVPVITGRLVDVIVVGHTPWAAFAMLLIAGALSIVAKFLSYLLIVEITIPTMRAAEAEAFAHVQRLSAEWHANTFAGSTVRKITRGARALDDMADLLLLALLPSGLILLGTIGTLASFHWGLGLIGALGAGLFVAISFMLTVFWVAPAARLANAQDSRVSGAIADAINSNSVVRTHAGEAREDQRLEFILGKWAGRTRRTWQRITWTSLLQDVTIWGLRAAILSGALVAYTHNMANAGEIAFVVSALSMLDVYLRQMGNHLRSLQQAVNDAEELVDLMRAAPEKSVTRAPMAILPPRSSTLTFERVSFRYAGTATPLFTDLSVTIPIGQKVGLVGRSGSGKTTFVKLIQRIHEINCGTITIGGINLQSVPLGDLRKHVALVPQDPVLFHRSLVENIAYARPDATMAEVLDAATHAGASDFITRLPMGFSTIVGERGVKLSGGERQLVAIARAFLSEAPFLIMDEATSSLDPETEEKVAEAAERLMQGRTTLVIAHRLATVERMDRILVFYDGKIVEDGTPAELLAREHSLYSALRKRETSASYTKSSLA